MDAMRRIYDWLATADDPRAADVIFVLAGREYRKDFAVHLLEQGWADCVVFSVGRFEIRRFAHRLGAVGMELQRLAASVPPPVRHYFVALSSGKAEIHQVSIGRFGTWSEIRAFAT